MRLQNNELSHQSDTMNKANDGADNPDFDLIHQQ